jgi:PRTRC genetic system protein A
MGAALKIENEKRTQVKTERTKDQADALKRELFLNINSYHVGSWKDAKLDKIHNHIFQGDGDYLVVNNKIANFIVKMNEAKRPGLPEEFNGHKIQLKVPRIPKKIYYQIIGFFRDIAKTMGNSEAFIQVYYDKINKEYVCHVPEQTVSGASVSYDATANLNEVDRDRYISVFEIHSHNTMNAFWSGTDNADEKETKFYGVFGKINDDQIDERFRFMAMGKQVDLTKENIFDFDGSEDCITKEEITEYINTSGREVYNISEIIKEVKQINYSFPKEWKDKVKDRVTYPTNPHFGGRGSYQKWGPGEDDDIEEDFKNWDENRYKTWGEQRHFGEPSKGKLAREDKTKEVTLPGEDIIDIDDTFDVNQYEPEFQPIIIETFAANLDRMQVQVLLDALVDNGHDNLIQYFRR